MWHRKLVSCVFVVCVSGLLSFAQDADDIKSPRHRAWDLLVTASLSDRSADRIDGLRVLGLLRDNTGARQFAEYALRDHHPDVRRAAATALGQMHAKESIPKLEAALSDKEVPVVMAAAQALRELKAEKQAYAIYYDLLTGERKSDDGLIARQLKTLKDPKQLAEIGISEGVGFVPFAGIGWDAYRTIHKKDPNPVRAVAAGLLAHDPDPATGRALVRATYDKNWMVREAAVEAIAQRDDPSLLPHLVDKLSDRSERVRYSAAAAVIRLSAIEQSKTAKNGR